MELPVVHLTIFMDERKPDKDGEYFIYCHNQHDGYIEATAEFHDGDFYLPEDKGYPSDPKKIIAWLEPSKRTIA